MVFNLFREQENYLYSVQCVLRVAFIPVFVMYVFLVLVFMSDHFDPMLSFLIVLHNYIL